MKLKFLALSIFVTINILGASARVADDNQGHDSTGTVGIMSFRSLFKSSKTSINTPTNVTIYSANGLEIAYIPVNQFNYFIESLTAGEYIAIYTNNRGNILNQTSFSVGD